MARTLTVDVDYLTTIIYDNTLLTPILTELRREAKHVVLETNPTRERDGAARPVDIHHPALDDLRGGVLFSLEFFCWLRASTRVSRCVCTRVSR